MIQSTQRHLLFHPVTVFSVSLVAAAIFAFFITLFFEGDFRWFLLYYYAPVGIPFIAFLFDRAEQYALTSIAAWATDLAVLIPSLTRAFVRIPLVSGHALFLIYCLLTARSKVARITAVVVLVQVVYLKLFVTHDTALFGGLIAAGLAAVFYRWVRLIKEDLPIQDRL